MSRKFFEGIVVIAAAWICVAGCNSSQSGSAENEHLEHVVPEHRPADFSAAVERLQQRIDLLKVSPQAEPKFADELRDLVRWLPEIAGDSELRKAQWEIVRDQSRRLNRLIETPLLVSRRTLTDEEYRELSSIMVALKELVPLSREKKIGAE